MGPAAEPARGDPSRPPLLAGLDPAQAAAVTTPSTLVAVIAGAGSGKTRVLTTRIAHRIAIGTADARHTLALTFTREAAGELRRRLRRAGVRDHVEAGHVPRRRPRPAAPAVGRPRPPPADDRRRPRAAARRGRRRRPARLARRRGRLGRGPGRARPAATSTPPGPPAVVARRRPTASPPALAAYETLKRRRGVVDFDDLLVDRGARAGRRPGVGRRRPLPLPPRAGRRGPGPQPGAAAAPRRSRRRARRPVPRR